MIESKQRQDRWPAVGLFVFTLIAAAITAMRFNLMFNEGVYLINGKRFIDPSFLRADWTLGVDPWYFSITVIWDAICGLMWSLTDDPLVIAIVGRLIAWLIVAYGLVRLSKALNIRPIYYCFGLSMWLFMHQGYGACEWIFGGIEQKVLSYAAVILALEAACRHQVARSGFFAACAISTHILVGGWSALILGTSMLLMRRPLREVSTFAATALVISFPVILICVRALLSMNQSADPQLTAELFVIFGVPLHLDPHYFLTPGRALLFALLTVAAVLSVQQVVQNPSSRRLMMLFVSGLGIVYASGIICREIGALGPLKYYPFRVGDVLLPLLFWLTAPQAFIAGIKNRRWLILQGAVVCLALIGMSYRVTRIAIGSLANQFMVSQPASSVSAQLTSMSDEMRTWIRAKTDRDAVFAVYPYHFSFWIETGRAMVVHSGVFPSNGHLVEWYDRLRALNGGEEPEGNIFSGFSTQLVENFVKLNASQIQNLRTVYHADYILLPNERADLKEKLAFSDGKLYLYDLR